jgi:ABC-type iron transport system FetAB permease component
MVFRVVVSLHPGFGAPCQIHCHGVCAIHQPNTGNELKQSYEMVLLLRGPRWTSLFLLAAMIFAAGATSRRRAKGIPGAFKVSTYSIACGAGSVIALMTWLGVIDTDITSLIPVGSMLIANAMNTNGLALNRFHADVINQLA